MIKNYYILILVLFTAKITIGQGTIGIENGYYNPLVYQIEDEKKNYTQKEHNQLDNFKPSFYLSLNYADSEEKTFNFNSSIGYKKQFIQITNTKLAYGNFYYHSSESKDDYQNNYLFFNFKLAIKPIKKIPIWVNIGQGFDILLSSKKDSEGHSKSNYINVLSYSNWNETNIKNKDASNVKVFFLSEIKTRIKLSKKSAITFKGEINYNLEKSYENIKTSDLFIGVGYQFLLEKFSFKNLEEKLDKFSLFRNSGKKYGIPYILNH